MTTKKCKVCGKEYECCRTFKKPDGIFHWRDVACCPEHAQEYLARIEKSRAATTPEPEVSEDSDKTEYLNEVLESEVLEDETTLIEYDESEV